MERLLATWRHLFKNGGWKSLEGVDAIKPQVREKMEKRLAGFTWNYFVEEIVLKDTFVNESKVELDNFDGMGAWIKNHWAPYWLGSFDLLIPIGTVHFRRYTCRVCSKDYFPDFILKTETLPWDIPLVFDAMNLPDNLVFPNIRVTGSDDDGSEGNKPSKNFVRKYYSRLSKKQVSRLYQLYKKDHDMFNYSPEKYIAFAK